MQRHRRVIVNRKVTPKQELFGIVHHFCYLEIQSAVNLAIFLNAYSF